MKNIKNKAVPVFLALSMIFGGAFVASAQTNTATSTLTAQIQSLLDQIKNLQAQIANLQTQRNQVMTQLRDTLQLTKGLSLGEKDDEVENLQKILASDPSIYPEGLVTGFFGPLTEKAVKKFQEKHGIEKLGIVGPRTRAALLSFWGNASTTPSFPPGIAKKIGNMDDEENDHPWTWGTTTVASIAGKKILVCHNGHTINISTSALSAHLAHGDSAVPCGPASDDNEDDDNGGDDNGTSNTDTVAPVISNISVSNVSSTTATVSWSTNENASSIFWYATTTPLNLDTATKSENATLSTSHNFGLSGLSATTTYYFLISATDASHNTSTSTGSFATPAP